MVFAESSPPDVTESLPFPFTAAGLEAAQTFPADSRFDVTFGELGFLLRASREHPYVRASEDTQRQRIDMSEEAGEQSLGSWWIRSQVSWHMGAGVDWYEPRSDAATQFRFRTSHNVNVWDEGHLTLLPATSAVASGLTSPVSLSTARRAGADGFLVGSGASVSFRSSAGVSVVSATVPAGVTQPAVVGEAAYVGGLNAVSKWVFTGSGTLSTLRTCTGTPRCWWVKSRLLVALGPAVYWVNLGTTSGALPVAAVDVKVAEHPDPDWVWTDIAESPDAILMAGYSAATSGVYSVTVTEDSGVPEFTGMRQVAALPPGETVRCMGTYLSSYVVLGTSKGVRVGLVQEGGSVRYGPLTVETTQPVVDVSFSDRFAYLPVTGALADGTSGVVRVDLSAAVGDTDFYAWAWDVTTGGTATATSVCFVGGLGARPVVAAGSSVFMAGTAPAVSGWVESGGMRFGTTELKNFRYVQTNGDLNNGSVDVTAVNGAAEDRVVSYGAVTGLDGEPAINIPRQRPVTSMAFRLYLTPSTGGVSPDVTGFAVKALPAARKSRLYRFPLSCFDIESDRNGNEMGYVGSALIRLLELERAEDQLRPIKVEDRRVGDSFVGVIDSVEFSGTASPDRDAANFGGVATVTVRRL